MPYYTQLDLIWYSNYWDGPLDGICKYNGKLCRFIGIDSDSESDDYNRYYYIYKLDFKEKIKLRLAQFGFEACIGTHCTYKDGKRSLYYERYPKWFWKIISNLYYGH